MPFAVQGVLQQKCNERQRREIHEREYLKYISNLRHQTFNSSMSHLPIEHIQEMERSKVRYVANKTNQYERIRRENQILSERFIRATQRAIVEDKNDKYRRNLEIFNSKHLQQRANDYKRIKNENHLLMKRFNNAHGFVVTKEQCDQDWQHNIDVMKKASDYPENIDQFVSNITEKQYQQVCQYKRRLNINQHLCQLSEDSSMIPYRLSRKSNLK